MAQNRCVEVVVVRRSWHNHLHISISPHTPNHTTPHQVREGLKTKGAQMVGCIIHTFTALGPTLLRTKSGAHHSFIQWALNIAQNVHCQSTKIELGDGGSIQIINVFLVWSNSALDQFLFIVFGGMKLLKPTKKLLQRTWHDGGTGTDVGGGGVMGGPGV